MVFIPEMATAGTQRRGIVLLVVMALLALFAAVGLSFVFYADAEAAASQNFREAATTLNPDVPPEILLSYFLGQLIYDTDDTDGYGSALRGHSLARSLYGYNSQNYQTSTVSNPNVIPFDGTGRLHYVDGNLAGTDAYYLPNYTYLPGDSFVRDPQRIGNRAKANLTSANTSTYYGSNASYTYGDLNNMFLATVTAKGEVLQPSWFRSWAGADAATSFGSMAPTNANWTTLKNWRTASTAFRWAVLRPPDLGAPEDGGGDVKCLDNSPGTVNPAGGYFNNDSIWLDLGFPIWTAPNGVKYKPLFASLIIDLDNKININAVGNLRGGPGAFSASNHGLGVTEINPAAVLGLDWKNIFNGSGTVTGRYGADKQPGTAGGTSAMRFPQYSRFYSPIDFDGVDSTYAASSKIYLPGDATSPTPAAYLQFPYFDGNAGTIYGSGSYTNGNVFENTNHPFAFNYSSPGSDTVFVPSQMEALLRYQGTGSPALASDLFKLFPNDFTTDVRRMKMITTHSMAMSRPGLSPWLTPGSTPALQLAGNNWGTPSAAAVLLYPPQPVSGAAPGTGEFATTWQGAAGVVQNPNDGNNTTDAYFNVLNTLKRLNLNRPLADYPSPDATGRIDTSVAANSAQYQQAVNDRVKLANDIFNLLRYLTRGERPSDALPAAGGADYNACRWLAQLAVNIVDYRDADDYSTPFNWDKTNNQEYVYGTELPRLVLNEVFAQLDNDPTDIANANKIATLNYKVNFWIELLNPFMNSANANDYYLTEKKSGSACAARLYMAATDTSPVYKIDVVEGSVAGLSLITNPRGELQDAAGAAITPKIEVSQYQPSASFTAAAGIDTSIVLPNDANYGQAMNSGTNQGFYVLGPQYFFESDTTKYFPGTDATRPKPTLVLKEQNVNGLANGLSYTVGKKFDAFNFAADIKSHTVVLRRLACPTLPYQNDPTVALYNPYITVDYISGVTPVDAVTVDGAAGAGLGQSDAMDGDHTKLATYKALAARTSIGKRQPYRANPLVAQAPNPALANQPQTTFFRHNGREATGAAFDPLSANQTLDTFTWLVHLDRFVNNPIELLQVSQYRPHELTQQFILNNGTMYQHLAPWFDNTARIYRFLEFADAGIRQAGANIDGRNPGKINLNTLLDQEPFTGLCDIQANSYFTAADVTLIFSNFLSQRSPGASRIPSASDRPIRSLATGWTNASATDGVESTLLASLGATNSAATARLFEPPSLAGTHPNMRWSLLSKIFNNVTTHSNVFAVWVTVGFFEVDDSVTPPKLGSEVGRKENRHIRHRMFAIVDRSALQLFSTKGAAAVPAANTTLQGALPLAPYTVAVNSLTGAGANGKTFQIQPGTLLTVDTGASMEEVVVLATDTTNKTITAWFTMAHANGFEITVRGNPGPIPRYNMRNDPNVVLHYSIIQ